MRSGSHIFDQRQLHLFSFAFGQCSITIRRQIRQFVIERNTSINSTTDCPISKTDWTLVIVNWTLCTTFGISKSFGQWAVSFITLVRMWEVPCQTAWNECRIVLKIGMPFFTHNVEVMLNDELKPNFAELLRTSANLSAPTAGWGAEFCSCVESRIGPHRTVFEACHLADNTGSTSCYRCRHYNETHRRVTCVKLATFSATFLATSSKSLENQDIPRWNRPRRTQIWPSFWPQTWPSRSISRSKDGERARGKSCWPICDLFAPKDSLPKWLAAARKPDLSRSSFKVKSEVKGRGTG